METIKFKVVKNEGATHVISNEEAYFAKGVKTNSNLEGEEYEYVHLTQDELVRLAKMISKEIDKHKKKKVKMFARIK